MKLLFQGLKEIKAELEIDPADTSEDLKLMFLNEQASQWIGEWLNRPGFDYKSRTEYYKGTGTQKLLLRSRPVYTSPTIQVFQDTKGWYGAPSDSFASTTALTYGTDFTLEIDQEDGSSRSGILIRINDLWNRPTVRYAGLLSPSIGQAFGTIKCIYTGGYTVDTLPAAFRLAALLLIAELRQLLPNGFLITSESYEERSVGWFIPQRKTLMAMIEPIIGPYRNFVF